MRVPTSTAITLRAAVRAGGAVELDTRHGDGLTVTLEWDRDTGDTQIVVHDMRSGGLIVFVVPPVSAADAFHHPFRYAP